MIVVVGITEDSEMVLLLRDMVRGMVELHHLDATGEEVVPEAMADAVVVLAVPVLIADALHPDRVLVKEEQIISTLLTSSDYLAFHYEYCSPSWRLFAAALSSWDTILSGKQIAFLSCRLSAGTTNAIQYGKGPMY